VLNFFFVGSAVTIDRFAIFDVETTGLLPERSDRIVEIAIVVMSADGVIEVEYETLVNPERDIGPTRIHGISAAEVMQAPRFCDIAGDVLRLFRDVTIIAGHNVSFDTRFLRAEFQRMGTSFPDVPMFCTCRLLGGQKLQVACEQFGVDFDGQAHRALVDARNTARLLHCATCGTQDDLTRFHFQNDGWPDVPVTGVASVTREHAIEQSASTPHFLQRIARGHQHDDETLSPDLSSYVTVLDQVLEDRWVDETEADSLIQLASDLSLNREDVERAHLQYLDDMVIEALADGKVTECERSDLLSVARLLGMSADSVDQALTRIRNQLESSGRGRFKPNHATECAAECVCFTGTLNSTIAGAPITKAIAKTLAERAGSNVAPSLTKKVDMLVVADPATQSGKAKKARQYGTRIVAEAVFWKMIGVDVD